MDKYAPYVWASYGVAFGLLTFLGAVIGLRLRNAHAKLTRLKAEEQGN